MVTELERCGAAGKRWRVGSYEFERIPRAISGPASHGRWGCYYRNMRGTMNHRTPIGAFLTLRRVMREPARPV